MDGIKRVTALDLSLTGGIVVVMMARSDGGSCKAGLLTEP